MDDLVASLGMAAAGIAWLLFGLSGHAILFRKQVTDVSASLVPAIVSIPIAAVLGPIWFAVGFMAPPMQLCPYCKRSIRCDAVVCPACTRDLATYSP